MPYLKCPLCGQISHASVGDVKQWYQEHHPNAPLGSLVPVVCYFCWPELEVGDPVVIRKAFSEDANTKEGLPGVITSVLTSNDGSIFAVRTESDQDLYFVRAQLRKFRVAEVRPDKVVD